MRGIIWMVGAALCLSLSFSFVRHLSDFMSTFEIVLLRQLFGTVIMVPWMLKVGVAGMRTRQIRLHVFRAFLGYSGVALAYFSLVLIPLADSVSLQFTLPLFTAIFASVLLGERVGMHRWMAIVVGFAGVLAIVRPGFAELHIGMLLALGAAAFYAGTDTASRALASRDSTAVIMFYGYILQLPIAAIPAALDWTTPTWAQMPSVLGFLVIATAAQYCITRAFSLAEASLVSPVLFLRLPFVAVIGYVVFDQVTQIWTWVGAGIIVVSTLALARQEARASRRSP